MDFEILKKPVQYLSQLFNNDKKELTNNDIVSLLEKCFINSIETESIRDLTLTFDVSFLVLMHPSDYASRETALPLVTSDIISIFYKKIYSKKNKYEKMKISGNNWFFQYSPTESFEGTPISIGKPLVFGTLVGLKSDWGQISAKRLRVSKVANNSKYDSFDINPEIFKNIDVLARGVFKIKIDTESLTPPTSTLRAIGHGYAEITYTIKGTKYTYTMLEKEISITRKSDSTPDAKNSILAIDVQNQGLENEHVRIKYNEKKDTFEITAFYDNVFINQKQIPVDPHSETLPDEASIMLGLFNIEFKKTK